MRSGPGLNGPCAALLSCYFDPNNMYSILSGFSLSHILSIQSLMLLNASSSYCLVVLSCCVFPALNVFSQGMVICKAIDTCQIWYHLINDGTVTCEDVCSTAGPLQHTEA